MRPMRPNPTTPMRTFSFAPRAFSAERAVVETTAVPWATRLMNSRLFIVLLLCLGSFFQDAAAGNRLHELASFDCTATCHCIQREEGVNRQRRSAEFIFIPQSACISPRLRNEFRAPVARQDAPFMQRRLRLCWTEHF